MHEVEINGKKYEVPKQVVELILNISKERDHYKSIVEGVSEDLKAFDEIVEC